MSRRNPSATNRLTTIRRNNTARRFDGSSTRVRLLAQPLEDRTVPATITINSIADDTIIDGKVTLREAQLSANFNADLNADVTAFRIGAYGAETLIFDAVLFATAQVISLTGGQLQLTGDTALQGTSAANVTVVRTAGISRVFDCNVAGAGNVTFANMTISGGNQNPGGGINAGNDSVTVTNCAISNNSVSGEGGGLRVTTGGTINITNSTISGNTANSGGGIYSYKGTVVIDNSTVTGNSGGNGAGGVMLSFASMANITNTKITGNQNTTRGGGLYVGNTVTALLQNSIVGSNIGRGIHLAPNAVLTVQSAAIINNTSNPVPWQNGGGISSQAGTLIIEDSSISGNTAANYGGGARFYAGGGFTMDRCTVSGNVATAGLGGGLDFSDGNRTVRNSTISGNTAAGAGGTYVGGSATVTMQNSTVALNQVGGVGGGGIRVNAGGMLSIDSTIVAKNVSAGMGTDILGAVNANFSLIGISNDGPVIAGGNNQLGTMASPLDPLLDALADNGGQTKTHALKAGSPALNVGSNPAGLTTDQRGPGFERVYDGVADIGAFEFQIVVLNANDSGFGSLRQAIIIANGNPGLDSISFDPMFFSVPQSIKLTTGELFISDPVAIAGPGPGLANVSGENNSRVFNIDIAGVAQPVAIAGLTISNGKDTDGGGIKILDDALTLVYCTLANNTAIAPGGAIVMLGGGSISASDCTFANNTAGFFGGGSIYISNGGSLLLLDGCTLSGNSALGNGGGLSFTGLAAGGIIVRNSTISGNSSGDNGGGIFVLDLGGMNSLKIQNSTITNNTAVTLGGGIRAAGTGSVSIESTAVSGNINANSPDISSTGGVTVNWSALGSTKGFSFIGTNNLPINANLKLGPLQDNGGNTPTHLPDFDSPLIDQGSNPAALTQEQRGATYNRIVGAGTDIGAVEAFTIDPTPPTVVITASALNINDFKVGSNALTLTATFNEPMNTTIAPSVGFPVENPFPSIAFASGSWTSNKVYEAKFNVLDLNVNLQDIDVRVAGGKDAAGNVHVQTTSADLIDLDTQNPIVITMTRNDPSPTNLAEVGWTVTFSEAVGGVGAGNFVLFNGGLTGSPAITSVMGGGTTWNVKASTGGGEGTLALYVTSTTGVTDSSGNPLAALPVIGPAYAIDHMMPQAAKLTTNTLTVTDFNVGPAGFQVTIEFNEPMNQSVNPTVSFPVENPAPTLTFGSGVWLNAKTYRANYTVADVGATLNDIDIAVSGGQDAVGNVQAPLGVNDLFDIDMASPTVSTVKINGGATQRSRVLTVEVAFDRHVTFSGMPNAAFQLQRQSDGKLPTLAAAVDDTGPTTIVTLTFSGTNAVDFTSLADGRYTMTIFASQVTSGGGILDGDGNGVGGDNYVLASAGAPNPPTNIFRLFGDITGDGAVAGNDFTQFRLSFGGVNPDFDFNNDGAVAASDFTQFRLRFGSSI